MLRSILRMALVSTIAFAAFPSAAAIAASAADPAVAPPASPRVAAACEQRSAQAEATKDEVTRVPRGDVGLTGCVSDISGIDAVVVRWASRDGNEHGRICTDPAVLDGQWRCTWDAGRLPLGGYELELVAVDAAGNRGSSTRLYELVDPAPAAPVPDPAPPTQDAQPDADATGTDAPAAPADSMSPSAPDALSDADPQLPAPDATTPDDTQQVEPAPADPATEPQPVTPPSGQVFSSIQQLVAEQVVACERGGSDTRPTDDVEVTSQRDQARLVLDCLRPALELAGAAPIELRETTPEPYAIVVVVSATQARADLDAALPDVVAGIPILLSATASGEVAATQQEPPPAS